MAFDPSMILRRFAALAALLAAMVATSAWVFYADDRLPSHSARIGILTIDLPEGRGAGTAFLVDECGILTNFHVVFGPWYVTALRPPSHDFTATFTLTEVTLPDGSHPQARAIPVVWGDYLGADRHLRKPEADWAYLTLDRCLGAQYGYFDLTFGYGDAPPVKSYSAIGYSTGRQMIDPDCSARADPAIAGNALLHDCATQTGDSGGPIIRDGTLTVVALASGYRARAGSRTCLAADPIATDDPFLAWSRGCANIAVPLTDAIRQRVIDAQYATEAQRALIALGFDAGPVGAIESPQALAAIHRAQRELGWPETDTVTCTLAKILSLRAALR
ncbi:MAG: trypsin-like peptidase domain-containing protein [Dongiaceae bacterium]